MFHWFKILLVVVGCGCTLLAHANDSLPDLRQVVRPPKWDAPVVAEEHETSKSKRKQPSESEDNNPWDHHDKDDDVDSGFVLDVCLLAGAAVTSPVWVPRSLLEGDTTSMAGYFPSHPYAEMRGYMIISPDTLPNAGWFAPHTHSWRLTSEYGTNFGGQEFVGGKLLWEHTSRVGFDTRFVALREERVHVDNDLWLGDANLLFRFAQHEKWQFRGGLGLNWHSEDARADLGVNFTYGVDWYPVKPWVLSSEIDLGTLGEGHLFHWQTTMGVNWKHAEGYVGYDYTDIGTAQFHFFLAGVRGWF
jgi:hypothetical protein